MQKEKQDYKNGPVLNPQDAINQQTVLDNVIGPGYNPRSSQLEKKLGEPFSTQTVVVDGVKHVLPNREYQDLLDKVVGPY